MAKRRYPIRIHWRHDPDIYTFISTHEFSFLKALYCAVTAFSKGEVFVIDVPPRKENATIGKRKPYYYVLILDEDIDGDAIQLIDQIAKNYRNSFFRNLLRLYLCMPISEEFLINKEGIDDFESRFQIFREGKRVAKAGKLARKPRNGYISAEEKLKSVFEDHALDIPTQSQSKEAEIATAETTDLDSDNQNETAEPGSAANKPKQGIENKSKKQKKQKKQKKSPKISSIKTEHSSDISPIAKNEGNLSEYKNDETDIIEKPSVSNKENEQPVEMENGFYIEPPDSDMEFPDDGQDRRMSDPHFTEPDNDPIGHAPDDPADEDELTDFFFSLVG